jgi:hypothetical protein
MLDSSFIFIFVAFLALIVVGAYFSQRAKVRRQNELAALAQRIGWQFDPASDSSHNERYPQFSVFQQGHSRAAYNTLRGNYEVDGQACLASMGDFRYSETHSNGKQTTTTTYHFSYLIVHTPYPREPQLSIRREGLFDKIGGFFGFDDIDFESAEFSDRFCVKSTDKRFAYDVIHPRMMEFLLDGEPPTIEIGNGQGCFFRRNTVWTANQFAAVLAWSHAFFDLWPNHLISARGQQTQSG